MQERQAEFRGSHDRATTASRIFGEEVAEFHAIPENYPGANYVEYPRTANGTREFDQIWETLDGRYVVVEAKSRADTPLGAAKLPDGTLVSQGTRQYFDNILRAMRDRTEVERHLARQLRNALAEGRLDYVLVQGAANGSQYSGYTMRQFNID